jgi:hypothetical protein
MAIAMPAPGAESMIKSEMKQLFSKVMHRLSSDARIGLLLERTAPNPN